MPHYTAPRAEHKDRLPPIDPVITRNEVCALAKVSEDTLRRAVAAGKLTKVQLSPRRVGFRRSEVERWLRDCEA